MIKQRSKFWTNTLTYDGGTIWNHFYFGFFFNELNLAKPKPKALLQTQKVICNEYLIDDVLPFSSSTTTVEFENCKSIN